MDQIHGNYDKGTIEHRVLIRPYHYDTTGSLPSSQCCGSGSGIRRPFDPDPGLVKNQDPDPGSGLNTPKNIFPRAQFLG
jgi:hypothetical protein